MFDILRSDGKIEKIQEKDICKGAKTILYFYPKDNTPGCTTEAKEFTDLKNEFLKLGYNIIGVSKDDIKSHERFKEKHNLNIDIISDPDLILHKKFGTYGEKKMCGKTQMGVIRSTFILDENCNIIKEYRNVRAKGHAERVLNDIKNGKI